MFLIGLTGGIASGKSTVANFLQALGAEIIDADQVAREVVEPGTAGLNMVIKEFGSEVLASDGSLSRAKLAEVVFANEQKRLKLEAILHPLIKTRTQELIAQSTKRVVVYAVPLLVEAKVDYPFDLVLTVEAGPKAQLERMMNARGMTEQEAKARLEAQAKEADRVARADIRLDSSGTLEELETQVQKVWEMVQERLEAQGTNGAN